MPMKPQDSCSSSTMTLRCSANYVVIVKSASYGVARIAGSCAYTPGDCVADAMSAITCTTDAVFCNVFATRKRLPQCNDQFNDYLHVEFDCVPLSMDDPANEYNVCQNGTDITSDYGILKSPGYPTQFQTTTAECFRSIQVPRNKTIRLWLTDLYIGSLLGNCVNDHVYVVDSIQTYRHCSRVRYSYPYICSSTIIIQYFVKTQLSIYRGMRMYYDIIDRPANDNCPNSNVTVTTNLDELEEMHPSIRDTCINDYLIINAPHVAYVYCGTRKLAILPICTTAIDIQYKTSSPPNLFYKGFKLYFEWIPKPIDLVCPGTSPATTMTSVNTTLPIWAQNLQISPIFSAHVCLGSSITLQCPRDSDYVLSIVQSMYGVTATGLCENPSPADCLQEASLGLTCAQSCYIGYYIPKPLVQCQSKNADYILIDYQCIPMRLPNNDNTIDICNSTIANTIALDTVMMMISPQYPTLDGVHNCSKTIEASPNKRWMISIVDLFLEEQSHIGDCDVSSLTIVDEKDQVVMCGLRQPELVMVTYGNIVEFKFISTHQALGYRGFKVYAETIMNLSNVTISTMTTTTAATTRRTSPPITTFLPVSLQIPVYGGTTTNNGTRQYCKFPFIYQGNPQSNCLTVDPPIPAPGEGVQEPWCSLTSNFDTDGEWGFCDLRVTDATVYDICRSQSQLLSCPSGYVIDIITSDYATKPDGNIGAGACAYDKNDCFQSDSSTIQNTCTGRLSCMVYHFAKTLATCENRPSAYLHIGYTCVPNNITSITTYNLCDNSSLPQMNTSRGFITSPNFPTTPSNIDCTFNLQTLKPYEDIYLYILDMDLNSPNLIGQSCTKDRFIVSSDNNVMEMCGRSYTNFLLSTCHSSVLLQLIRASDARGRGVKLYFEFRGRSPQDICPEIIATSSTLQPTPPTGLTTMPEPSQSIGPSPHYFTTLCFPDISSLFGRNNFQCQTNYILVILRAVYGRGSRCDYSPGDCTSEADNVYRLCSGKQKCSVPFLNPVTLPECNGVTASYLFVEYQCQISDFNGTSGILQSTSYPSYTQTQCANATLSSLDGSNLVMHMYLIDLSISASDPHTGECLNDYLELSYQCNHIAYTRRLCGTRSTELLFRTCLPTDKIFASYNLLGNDSQSQRGFALLYHLVPRDSVPTIKTTTASTTTTLTSSGIGAVSTPIQLSTICVQESLSLRCDQPGYVLVLHKIQLGVSTTASCNYSLDDCFEDYTSFYNNCTGTTMCDIFSPLTQIASCNNSQSNYLYAEHQCIPASTKLDLDICSSAGSIQIVTDSTIISSLNYTSEEKECKVELRTNSLLPSQTQRGFKVYILTLNLPIEHSQDSQCDPDDPSIEIDDPESGLTRLCGDSYTRFLFETCSNTIEIRYKNTLVNTTAVEYKGFEIYVESIENDECRLINTIDTTYASVGLTSTTTVIRDFNTTISTPNLPLIIGLSVGLSVPIVLGAILGLIYYIKVVMPKKKVFISNAARNEIPMTAK
ncbi:unnamed protein product [Rotaria socialis]|uniref:CUB domain-containing protein n=5 Tax=Rotaria socialis TaxID=392032 RepID=A0A818CGW3_9BILA|nr:unnamed protein product [Rotaria socialis]